MQLELTEQEIAGIIQTLGQLPTSSGAYPLMLKIQQQVQQSKTQEQA